MESIIKARGEKRWTFSRISWRKPRKLSLILMQKVEMAHILTTCIMPMRKKRVTTEDKLYRIFLNNKIKKAFAKGYTSTSVLVYKKSCSVPILIRSALFPICSMLCHEKDFKTLSQQFSYHYRSIYRAEINCHFRSIKFNFMQISLNWKSKRSLWKFKLYRELFPLELLTKSRYTTLI